MDYNKIVARAVVLLSCFSRKETFRQRRQRGGVLTPLQMMMHGPLSDGSLITLPKLVLTLSGSR
jgi:hypothetical protein